MKTWVKINYMVPPQAAAWQSVLTSMASWFEVQEATLTHGWMVIESLDGIRLIIPSHRVDTVRVFRGDEPPEQAQPVDPTRSMP